MTTRKTIARLASLICISAGILVNTQAAGNDVDQKEAAELYHDYCSVCHGDRGDGQSRARDGLATKPRDFTVPGIAQFLPRERIAYVILNGVPNTPMVGWKTRLSQAQADAIAEYIHTKFMVDEAPAAVPSHHAGNQTMPQSRPVDMSLPMPHGLSADVESGKAFYEFNCSTCHGTTGMGDGPRAYFIFPKPRNFTTEDSRQRLNRPNLFQAIKYGIPGKEMPAWGKVLSDDQIANVAEYVYRNMITR